MEIFYKMQNERNACYQEALDCIARGENENAFEMAKLYLALCKACDALRTFAFQDKASIERDVHQAMENMVTNMLLCSQDPHDTG